MLFSIEILIKKGWKIDFCSFWQDLGFDECFFYSNSNLKSLENFDFFSFWQDLGFGECFFYSNST